MSCHVGIRCLDHDTATGCGMNHGQRVMTDLIRMGPHFAAIRPLVEIIRELDTLGYVQLRMPELDIFVWEVDLLDWMMEHGRCKLEIYNEYGRKEGLEECPIERK